MTKRALTVTGLAFALAALGVAGCGSGQSGEPAVVATTGVIAEITERITGPDIEVIQLIPDSASPHDFQLSAQDRAKAESSPLLVSNGASLEAGIPLDAIGDARFELADHVGALLEFGGRSEDQPASGRPTGESLGAEGTGPSEHAGGDPHIWMDPTRVARALPALAEALATADPPHARGYRRRARQYAAELRQLDREVAAAIRSIPPEDRKLVTSHDALGYFADRYGLEVLPTPFPASGPEGEPSASAIGEVEQAIRDSGVPAVFAEASDDAEVLARIAERTGVEIVADLLVESPGEAGSYIAMLRHDARLISEALALSR